MSDPSWSFADRAAVAASGATIPADSPTTSIARRAGGRWREPQSTRVQYVRAIRFAA
jgi:hypothetical protein